MLIVRHASKEPDWTLRNDHFIDVGVVLGLGDPSTAEIEVDPDCLDLQFVDRTETEVGFFEGETTADPATKDSVICSGRVELGVLFDAIPAIVLQQPPVLSLPSPSGTVLAPHIHVIAVEANRRSTIPLTLKEAPS